VGFPALDVLIKMRLEDFLQVSIFAMYKLLGLLQGEINRWRGLSVSWPSERLLLPTMYPGGTTRGTVFFLESLQNPASSALAAGSTKGGGMTLQRAVWSQDLCICCQ